MAELESRCLGYSVSLAPGQRGKAGEESGLLGSDLTCIPLVAAASPGEVCGEATEEVEEGPGQDNDVVDVEEADDHL